MARDTAWSPRKSVLGLLLLFTLVLGFSCLTICSEFECVDDELLRAIITIWDGDTYQGTGFFFSPNGYILTNAHVILNRDKDKVRDNIMVRLPNGEKTKPTDVKWIYEVKEQPKDLALLKVDVQEHPIMWLGDSDQLEMYDCVHSLGYPRILVNSVPEQEIGSPTGAKGEVTRSDASVNVGTDTYCGLTQFSAGSFPGCSGSPVMDEECRVVGVNVVGYAPGTWDPKYNFFIPINVAITSIIGVDILPPYAPEITSLPPPEVKADGNYCEGKIDFRDLNADVVAAYIELKKGEDVVMKEGDENVVMKEGDEVKILAAPQGQYRKMEGELKYLISTKTPQEKIILKVQLEDAWGKTSGEPIEAPSFPAIDPFPHPPAIRFLTIPGTTIGSKSTASVGFEDLDGDITNATVELIGAQGEPWSLSLRDYPSANNPVYGQLKGVFAFLIEATVTPEGEVNLVLSGREYERQEFHVPPETVSTDGVTVRVTLSDDRGHTSNTKKEPLVIKQPEVDLVASLLEPPPEYLRVGESLNVPYRVQNTGETDSGPFRTGIYLSEGTVIGTEEKALLLASKEQSNLASGASFTEQVSVVLTQDLLDKNNLQVGSLYLGVVADDRNDVTERDETNNVQTRSLIVDPIPCTVPDEFPTIQAAIDSAQIDTITIAPGEYR